MLRPYVLLRFLGLPLSRVARLGAADRSFDVLWPFFGAASRACERVVTS